MSIPLYFNKIALRSSINDDSVSFIEENSTGDLSLNSGEKYVFDLNDASASNHPLSISETKNGIHADGATVTKGIKFYAQGYEKTENDFSSLFSPEGTLENAFMVFEPSVDDTVLYYYCLFHNGMANDAKIIIDNYEKEISGFSKEHLAIKLKYINALVLSGKIYDQYLDEVLTEGQLEKLMVFFKYEENNKHVVSFLEKVVDFIKKRLPPSEHLKENNKQTIVEKKAAYFKKILDNDVKTLMQLGFFETSLSKKVKALKTFYDAAKSAPEQLKIAQNLKKTNRANLKIIETIKNPKFFNEPNEFCLDAQKEIISETNKNITKYKQKIKSSLKKEVNLLDKIISEFDSGYPKLEKDSTESCQIVRTFVSNIDDLKKVISLEKIFTK